MSALLHGGDNRAFNYAVLASLVLHAVLVFGITQRERPRAPEPPPPIVARLIEPAPAPVIEVPPRVEPARPATPAEPIKPAMPKKPRPRAKPAAPKPPAVAREEPQPQPAQPEAVPALEAEPVLQPEPAPAPATAPPAVVARVEPAPEAVVLAQFRREVLDAARRYKRYPRVAMENNWEGDVVVRMALGADGAVSLSIKAGSKHPVLDKQALEMFTKASAAVQVPPVLRGKPFAIDLRAIYNLRDQDDSG